MDDLKEVERGNRYAINNLLSGVGINKLIGIYTAPSADKVPKGALMVNGKTGEIAIATKASTGDVENSNNMIVEGFQSGNMVDMIRLQTHINRTKPDSIFL